MSRLIEDLLDVVRIEKGRFSIQPAEHDLAALLEQALHDVEAPAQAKAVQLHCTRPQGDYGLRCDGARVSQVLANLLGNAVKFSPEGAVVEVELQPGATHLAVKVTDRGPGIAESDLPRVFTRYWQAKETAYKGTGLGLFIAKGIVEAHGGRIDVHSRPGQGATFTVVLPRRSLQLQ
jgi:signal transduction histidine kinase